MTRFLQLAGLVQILIAAANVPAKRMLAFEADLVKLTPIVRQVHRVQHAYIVAVLLFFAGLCLLRPQETAADALLCGFLALFWGSRILIQRLYYDPEVKRRHRAADVFFTLCFAYLAAVFGAAAVGGLR